MSVAITVQVITKHIMVDSETCDQKCCSGHPVNGCFTQIMRDKNMPLGLGLGLGLGFPIFITFFCCYFCRCCCFKSLD